MKTVLAVADLKKKKKKLKHLKASSGQTLWNTWGAKKVKARQKWFPYIAKYLNVVRREKNKRLMCAFVMLV